MTYTINFNRLAEVEIPISVQASSEEEAIKSASEILLASPTHDWRTIEGQTIQKKDFWVEGIGTVE
jgi:hypothetical protein|tara:strand:+ start:115 stop:312 length:198 start_codon:yes stop_codon:yes gene_type:complete